MTNKTLTLIKHKLQWLALLVALLGVSQGVWGATYPANTPVYVRSTTDYGTDVTIHTWGGSGETSWPGQEMTYLGKIEDYYYWTYTFSYTFTSMIVVDGGSTKISGDSDGAVSSETENCITVTGSGYSWSTYDICDSFSTPGTVLDGIKVMYYINQSYGGTTLKVTNNKENCIDENTEYTPIDNNNVYVLQSTGNVPSSLRVSNNCGSWAGAGNFENVTAANAAGARFVTGDSNSKTDATTLSTFTSSASSIKKGTSSITLTLTASKATSSYGSNSNIYAIVYVGSTKKGCLKLSTSVQTLDIDTSDLTEGSYTIKAVLSDGTIYYLDSTPISLTVVAPCTAPTVVTNSTVSSITASGATVKGTITDGTCSVTASGIAYGTSTNPTSGTSVVYTSGTEFSANLTGLSAGTKYYFRTYATANGTTTYGEEHSFTTLYEEPSAIYIKGPIHDADCWPGYNDTPLTKNGTTYSQTFSAYNNTSCSYGPKEFVLSTSTSDANKLNGNKTFNGAGTNGWAYSTRDGANTNFNCTLDYSAGEKITLTVIFDTSTGEYTMTMAKACTTPTEGFAITAQLNVGKGSPWEGTQGTSGGDHASGGVFADGYRTATLTTSISATNYEWYGCESDGSNETTTPANVTFTDRTSQTCTAQFNLPGTYYFKCKAGCADASVASGVVQINVPYPSMGISGPFLSGNDTWDHAGAGTGGLMERDGLTWTKTFECNTASGEFVIIQQYKLGCDKYNGWDGYKECNDDGKGNKINSSTLNCTNINWSKGNNMTAAIDGLSNNEKVTITVTMTGYDTYTVTMAEYSPQLSGTDITGLNFNDCEGSHQFNFSDMFKFNVDSWSAAVTDSEVDATSDFELTQEGYMVWNTSDKEAGDYSYTFTAYKSGSSATALLTFTYSAKAKLNDITIVSGETPTYPYIKIELECSVGGSVNDIKWSVDNNGLVVRTGIGTAYFKGKAVNKSTTYTISAVGLSDTCGETEPKTIEIVVNPEPEEVCTAN